MTIEICAYAIQEDTESIAAKDFIKVSSYWLC